MCVSLDSTIRSQSKKAAATTGGRKGIVNHDSSSVDSGQYKEEERDSSPSLSRKVYNWAKTVSGMACTGSIPDGMGNCPPKPPRPRGVYDQYEPTVAKSTKGMSVDEQDHHTLATASTTAATISYSTDYSPSSEASEAGMEIVMSAKDTVSGDEGPRPIYSYHSFKAGSHTFTVDARYSMIRLIGSGAYGVVISAQDAVENRNVAIKMVPRAFNDEIDAKRILREIKLMKHFSHENIVNIIDMMPPLATSVEDFRDVYIVSDLMETDLHRIIYSKQSLSIDHAQYFVYQMLRGLKYIHSANVIHRDLKPSNLLVNSNCDLKICDFGLARGIRDDHVIGRSMLLTEYVVTRWYRAPEIMLACHEYSKPVDVWSVGCIFAELIKRKPYFPGDDYIDQVSTNGIRRLQCS